MILRISFLLVVFYATSCANREAVPTSAISTSTMDTIVEPSLKIQPLYQNTPPLIWKLIHTNLELSFDYKKQEVKGTAELTLRPYFYPQNQLTLDAKSFEIKSIKILGSNNSTQPNQTDYSYDGKKLTIGKLDKEYRKEDTLKIKIEYTAKPTEIKDERGKAITGAQGIYFINPLSLVKNQPTQIWTQGETEFSSCWFPTLDEPNQKTTQEIAVTVPEEYVSLSNGVLEFSAENGNGTRTDYWNQNKPHSPYLAMLAIGNFSIVKDSWRGKDVFYYVEPEYEKDAPFIFENTKEMLTFYSDKLGVEYPWDKYSQVVVRNFVSGAMENTSATLHGEFVQRHKRELIDYNPEGVIAHELFHQWFGDLVSCESWANLPLNEAFATYGEYLWKEYKYGKEEADFHLMNNLNGYLRESKTKREEWVRFDYASKDDMFDGHTYSKGARILHMLRTYSGDTAFFQALNTYLTKFAFQSAEMHQLRLIFEGITGQDYNWFFDQWAYQSGHPELEISKRYDTLNGNLQLTIRQIQDFKNHPLYQIPFSLEIHTPKGKNRYELWLKDEVNEYNIKTEDVPLWVDFDSEKYLLCEKKEEKPEAEWIYQYQNGQKFLTRFEAIDAISKHAKLSAKGRGILYAALSDSHHAIRQLSLNAHFEIEMFDASALEKKLSELAQNDPNSKIRGKALDILVLEFHRSDYKPFIEKALSDSSYYVIGKALNIVAQLDSVTAVVYASQLQGLENDELQFVIASIYSKFGQKNQSKYFISLNEKVGNSSKVRLIYHYKNFILRVKDDQVSTDGILLLTKIESTSPFIWVRRASVDALVEIEDAYMKEKANLEEQKILQTGNGAAQIAISQRLDKVSFILDFIDAKFKELENTETDQEILDAIFKEEE